MSANQNTPDVQTVNGKLYVEIGQYNQQVELVKGLRHDCDRLIDQMYDAQELAELRQQTIERLSSELAKRDATMEAVTSVLKEAKEVLNEQKEELADQSAVIRFLDAKADMLVGKDVARDIAEEAKARLDEMMPQNPLEGLFNMLGSLRSMQPNVVDVEMVGDPEPTMNLKHNLTLDEISLYNRGGSEKIAAIKMLRQRTGMSLMEAKNRLEKAACTDCGKIH